MQLYPSEYFTIVRQLDDPADTNVYYVRAIIRNSRTGVTIETVNLVDGSSQRFTKEWQIPVDVSGFGYYIDITTFVYTDAAYTTKSDTYGIRNDQYLVDERWKRAFGGGGGADIDYKRVRKIVQEEIEKLPKIEIPEQKEVDLSYVLTRLRDIFDSIGELPRPEKTDLKPVINSIQVTREAVKKAIQLIPQPKEIDLGPVLSKLEEVDIKKSQTALNELLGQVKGFFTLDVDTIKGLTQEIKDKLEKIPYIILEKEKRPEEVSLKAERRKFLL